MLIGWLEPPPVASERRRKNVIVQLTTSDERAADPGRPFVRTDAYLLCMRAYTFGVVVFVKEQFLLSIVKDRNERERGGGEEGRKEGGRAESVRSFIH